MQDLVNKTNAALGAFCAEFQYTRKRIKGLSRAASTSTLFKYSNDDRLWAINSGGGTEVQFQLFFDKEHKKVSYGLGFNTQYVPFKNERSPVEYMRPFAEAFLNIPELKRELIEKGFNYTDKGEESLKNLTYNQYILFGKSIDVVKSDEGYELDDASFKIMQNDLKYPLFNAYQSIFEKAMSKEAALIKITDFVSVLEQKRQVILQGPPGTGKTYTAKDLAEFLIYGKLSVDKKEQAKLLSASDQFELVQFHPSYSYEDFVRGITAHSEKGQIVYQVKDQILGSFADKARKNQDASKKNIVEFNRRAWAEEKLIEFGDEVQEIINIEGKYKLTDAVSIVEVEADAFRYTGQNWKSDLLDRMKFSDIIEGYIENVNSPGDYRALESISRTAYQRYSYFYKVLERFKENLPEEPEIPKAEKPELKNYVLVIDEINRANLPAVLGELIYALEYRGEAVQSLYEKDGDRDMVLPENLYIIGTMNTADRSVGHIDYAIRRRFAFVEMLPEVLDLGDKFQREAFEAVSKLFVKDLDKDQPSDYISDEFKERPQDIWIGHSYFIATGEDFPMRMKYEIIPILEEYLKDGILNSDARERIKQLEDQYLNNA